MSFTMMDQTCVSSPYFRIIRNQSFPVSRNSIWGSIHENTHFTNRYFH
jgi:hypothetical protein